jgi:hypothetical protein
LNGSPSHDHRRRRPTASGKGTIAERSPRISACRTSTPGLLYRAVGRQVFSTAAIPTMPAMRSPPAPFPTAC